MLLRLLFKSSFFILSGVHWKTFHRKSTDFGASEDREKNKESWFFWRIVFDPPLYEDYDGVQCNLGVDGHSIDSWMYL